MWRCELIVTDRCNFRCPYCMGLRDRGDLPCGDAVRVLSYWIQDGLQHVRFSGGEPTIYPALGKLVSYAREGGVKRIAVSTNGSAPWATYDDLLQRGVDDWSVSLDACCASYANRMAGCECSFDHVCETIRKLSVRAYTTVGVVLTEQNVGELAKIIEFAHGLGVADIRVIPAAQYSKALGDVELYEGLYAAHPILRYRIKNASERVSVRGLRPNDSNRCRLVLDDSAVAGGFHYPCIIYMRQHGEPIGIVGPRMRQERVRWSVEHNTWADDICFRNCLDVCRDYNNVAAKAHES